MVAAAMAIFRQAIARPPAALRGRALTEESLVNRGNQEFGLDDQQLSLAFVD
jgi:hypothetical protein